MTKSTIIIGAIITIIGIALILFTKFNTMVLFYGAFATIVGIIIIIFNKQEDKIEKRKDIKN